MKKRRYDAVLDIFALTTCYPQNAESLAYATQLSALAYLRSAASKRDIIVLLRVAKDLGYVDDDLFVEYTKNLV